jgi:carnitine O-acetyltransferase
VDRGAFTFIVNIDYKARDRLIKVDPKNHANLDKIERALFAVCLEPFSTPEDINASHRIFFHGVNGRNRWFDKALQFIVMNNGRAGCCGEHSPSDAIIPSYIMDDVLSQCVVFFQKRIYVQ